MRKIFYCMLLAALLAQNGCGGAKSASTGSSSPRVPVKFSFGRSNTVASLYRVVTEVLNRYGYYRSQSGSTMMIDTDWRLLSPDEVEVDLGIVETRHRLEIAIANRRNTAEATLYLRCEGRNDKDVWLKIAPNPMVLRAVEEMQREVKRELSLIMTQW